jgi:hypothetical protein
MGALSNMLKMALLVDRGDLRRTIVAHMSRQTFTFGTFRFSYFMEEKEPMRLSY